MQGGGTQITDAGAILGSMSPARRRQLYFLLALVAAGAIAELATIAAVVPFLSLLAGTTEGLEVFQQFFTGSRDHQLLAASAIFAVAAVIAGTIRIALTWMTQSFSFGFGHDLALAIQTRLLYQPYAFHTSAHSGDLVAAHEKVFAFIHGTVLPALNGLTAAITSIFIIAILTYIEPIAAGAAVAAVAILYVGVTLLSRKRLLRYGAALSASHTERVRAVQESLGGIRDVILDQSHPAHLSHFAGISRRYSRAEMLAAFVSATPRYAIEAAGMVLIAAFALILARGGTFAAALPVLGAMALSAQRLLPLLQQVYQGWAQIRTGSAYASEIAALLRLDRPRSDGRIIGQPAPLPFARGIRFDDVKFRYPNRTEFILNGVSLNILRGSRTALVGRSGSGKSTLLDILMGLLDPIEGLLTIDGVRPTGDLRGAWQRQIAHVPQSIFLTDASFARNIAFGHAKEEVDIDRVRWAAMLAQAETFIGEQPDGYETPIGERGIRLSGGQRQRIGIARALYKRAPVLILDEATSALDAETEARVMRNLVDLGDGMTLIMVAHRHSTLECCDRLIRLEGGAVSEIGTYADFLERGPLRPLARTAV